MRSTLFLLIALLLSVCPAVAQPQISVSDPFEEPEGGYNKVLQVRNGNTFHFHITKASISYTIYDKAHKAIVKKEIDGKELAAEKIGSATINGIHDINGEAVIFFTQMEGRAPNLYRLRFNPETGALVEDKSIATIAKYKGGSGWAMAYGDVQPSKFHIEVDPVSNAYGVLAFHGFAEDSKERLKLYHYSADHKPLSEQNYGNPGNFKFINYIAMTVDDKKAIVAAYGFNTKAAGGKDSRVIISRLRAGETDFSHELLDYTDDFKETGGVMRYNSVSNKIQLLTCTYMRSTSKFLRNKGINYYMVLMSVIDPETLQPLHVKPLEYKMVSKYMSDHFKVAKPFSGFPQNMIVNTNGSTSVCVEETVTETITSSRGSVTYRTYLDNIGIVDLDTTAEEINGMGIMKSQYVMTLIGAFDQAEARKGTWQFYPFGMMYRNQHFFSFDYINTEKGRYVLFNDYPENQARYGTRKPETVKDVSSTNTIGYTLGKDKKTYYIFGKPADDRESTFFYLQSSDFKKSTGIYATLIVERKGRKKESRIAWLSFE